jgi:hypothetical protein
MAKCKKKSGKCKKKSGGKKGNGKGAGALKKITSRAKEIRKAHPSIEWKNAIKQASAEYRKS